MYVLDVGLSTNSKIIINSQYRFSISAHEAFIIMFILNRLKGHKLVTQIHLGELRKIGLGMSFDFESKESVNRISWVCHSKLH